MRRQPTMVVLVPRQRNSNCSANICLDAQGTESKDDADGELVRCLQL